MKILYLLSQRPDSTGSGIYTRALIDQATRAGHRCALVAAYSEKTPLDVSTINAESIHLVTFDQAPLSFPVPGMSDVMPYPSCRFKDLSPDQLQDYEQTFTRVIRSAVEAFAPDIIHSNHLWIMSALARRCFPDIPMVVSCHGTALRQFRNCPHLRETLTHDIPKMDGIFALSQNQKNEIVKLYGAAESMIHVVPNGFDPDFFYPASKPSVPPVFLLYAGKLSESKGVPLLLECMDHERLRHLPIHLHLAGSSGPGPHGDRIRDMAKRLSGKVTLCGALSPHDLSQRMRQAHLFVLPSFFEGLPLVIIEALASGCRIVTTDLPGTRELLSRIPGVWGQTIALPALETTDRPFAEDLPLIRDRLAEALENQILTHIENKVPPSDIFGPLKKNYSWKNIFTVIETIYHDLM